MIVMSFLARIRVVMIALALLAIAATCPTFAQKLGPDGAPNPTASVTPERALLKQVPRVEGRIDIPDTKAGVLIQPAGRTWDYFHQVLLRWSGAIVILGMIAVLGACACRKSNPSILVMQSAEDWAAKNTPCPLNSTR